MTKETLIAASGGRLDKILSELTSKTRSQIERAIESGRVTANGSLIERPAHKVRVGDILVLDLETEPLHLIPYNFPLEVLFEDQSLLVVNKPAGLTTHPGAGNKERTLVNALIGRSSFFTADAIRPGIVHRLDKDTSGVLVVAKNAEIHHALSQQFAARTVQRRYIALVYNTPRGVPLFKNGAVRGEMTGTIGRDGANRLRMAVQDRGKPAHTIWEMKERFSWAVLVAVTLKTGRTHQIRAHFHHAGAPLVGDRVYTRAIDLPKSLSQSAKKLGRQALHAELLGFIHPRTSQKLSFAAPVPPDMQKVIDDFRLF